MAKANDTTPRKTKATGRLSVSDNAHHTMTVRRLNLIVSLAACLGLGACGSDFNPVRSALVATGVGAETKPAPDFVSQSRPASMDYQNVGVAPPTRALKSKTVAEVTSMEADLDRVKAANEARAATARKAGSSAPAAPNTAKAPVK